MASKSGSPSTQIGASNDDDFYDSVNGSSPEFSIKQYSVPMDLDDNEKQEEWKIELAKLEDEIQTLKAVLNTKVRDATELKRKLGITTMTEIKQDLQHGITVIRESETVQKTNEKIHQLGDSIASSDAYQKTNAALKSFGAFASRKLGDFRNSSMFKSVEDKVGGAYSSMKDQLSGSQSTNNFDDSLLNENDNRGTAQQAHK